MPVSQLDDRTVVLEGLVASLRDGDETARERLIEVAQQRLRALAHDMLDGDRLRRWEETDDVLQDALVTLHRHLADARPDNVREFLALAAFHIRRALINMARHYSGPLGMATQHASGLRAAVSAHALPIEGTADASTPSQIVARSEQWMRLQEAVDRLPDSQREVTEMLWWHGLSQMETARILGVSERTVRRRWQRARLLLHQALGEKSRVFTGS